MLCDAVFGEDAAVVGLEQLISLEFNGNWAVSEHFLQNLLFSDLTPAFADELGVQDLGSWLARLVVGALLSLGHTFVWSALV